MHGEVLLGSAPKLHLCNHAVLPHVHCFAMADDSFERLARCRRRPCCFNCAIGLSAGSGSRASKRSSKSSTRQTLRNPDSCVATSPDSRRCSVLLETPASSASLIWVRFLSSLAAAKRLPNSLRIASSDSVFTILTTHRK